ncbi:hypothetical protein ACFQ46_03670 [Kineococcus sp. GCM10028916]
MRIAVGQVVSGPFEAGARTSTTRTQIAPLVRAKAVDERGD